MYGIAAAALTAQTVAHSEHDLQCLNQALALREEKGDRSLIDSTLHAMKVVVGYLP